MTHHDHQMERVRAHYANVVCIYQRQVKEQLKRTRALLDTLASEGSADFLTNEEQLQYREASRDVQGILERLGESA